MSQTIEQYIIPILRISELETKSHRSGCTVISCEEIAQKLSISLDQAAYCIEIMEIRSLIETKKLTIENKIINTVKEVTPKGKSFLLGKLSKEDYYMTMNQHDITIEKI